MYEHMVATFKDLSDVELQHALDIICIKNLKWELVAVNMKGQYIFRRSRR